ncbi:MAG: LytTR family DNA-binding domain-containing protein [Spirosomaceae bacterium]|nr:LytTR family DNA-binding domain-containing protein [Spirosomataceae bacterium]
MLTCIIIDDESINVEKLRGYIARLNTLELVFATTDPIEGANYVTTSAFDLVFLDIQMEEMNGIELARLIADKLKIIFTTASREYSVEAFEMGVLDYLHKPFGYDRFLKAVQKALDKQESKKSLPASIELVPLSLYDDIYLKGDTKSKLVRVRLVDILHVQADGNYLKVFTVNDMVMTLMTLKELEGQLPYPYFMRVHKSYIVAYDAIESLDGNEIIIKGNKKNSHIPIGGNYREAFLAYIKQTGKK